MNDKLSPANRTKIANVVEAAFKASQGGENPTQALVKAASEAGLTLQQTKRACEALNVSSTLYFNKTAALEDKARSFDIADPDLIKSAMFPSECPKKEASYGVNSGAYDLGEYKVDLGELEMAPVAIPEDTAETIYKRASDALLSGVSALNQAEAQELKAVRDVEHKLEKIAGMVGGLYGDSSASIGDEDIRDYINGMITKAASSRPSKDPSNLLNSAIDDLKDLFKVAGECGTITAEVRQEVEGLKKLSADTRYMALGDEASPIKTKIGPMDMAKFINPVMAPLIYNATQSNKARGTIRDNFAYNPYNDEKFRDVVQTRSMLQNAVMLSNMMKDDPVLNKAEPKNVVGAFNNIFATTPQLADNPELTRAALRYSVEYGGMDFPTMLSAMKDADKLGSDKKTIAELSGKMGEKNKGNLETYNKLLAEGDQKQAENRDKAEIAKEKRRSEAFSAGEKELDRRNKLIDQLVNERRDRSQKDQDKKDSAETEAYVEGHHRSEADKVQSLKDALAERESKRQESEAEDKRLDDQFAESAEAIKNHKLNNSRLAKEKTDKEDKKKADEEAAQAEDEEDFLTPRNAKSKRTSEED